ncbi:MAG TPA: histidine phosphatase family protein [Burkholderiales bacterium]|jgi:broad specificity phosphatase PhoE|nr:histidine phosphatase family protein [Burkholderiales bacterium]
MNVLKILSLTALVLAAAAAPSAAAGEDDLWNLLNDGGQVVLLRHGPTDPMPGRKAISLQDCSTQRNLSDEGRDQARRIGEAFRLHRIPVDQVLASPWCRCVETAGLAFGGADIEPALGNLYGRASERPQRVRELKALVSEVRESGNLVLVSHSATILALTGIAPAPGEAVVITPLGDGRFAVAGRLELL